MKALIFVTAPAIALSIPSTAGAAYAVTQKSNGDAVIDLYSDVENSHYDRLVAAVEKTTEDVLVCLCREIIATKGSEDPSINPCADKYCKASFDKCAPSVVGDLELCVMEDHEECTLNWPDFTQPRNVSHFFVNMFKCFAPPTTPPVTTSEPSETIVNPLPFEAQPKDAKYLQAYLLPPHKSSFRQRAKRFPPYHPYRSLRDGSDLFVDAAQRIVMPFPAHPLPEIESMA